MPLLYNRQNRADARPAEQSWREVCTGWLWFRIFHAVIPEVFSGQLYNLDGLVMTEEKGDLIPDGKLTLDG